MPGFVYVLISHSVALRKESVDRNESLGTSARHLLVSLSARRAWIEIKIAQTSHRFCTVALRKESVDRNDGQPIGWHHCRKVALRKESVDRNSWAARARVAQYWSLSARRAWIEMGLCKGANMARSVALRKESVDRNAAWTGVLRDMHRRSPQGERG